MSYWLRLIMLLVACQSNMGFSKSWQTMAVIDPMGMIRSVICEREKDYAVIEDDILIKEYSPKPQSDAAILQKIGGGRWEKSVIYYLYHPTLSPKMMTSIEEAMHIWESYTNVRFKPISQANDIVNDYIIFIPDSNNRCASYVGKQGGVQAIRLAPRCHSMNIVHELGHAIGLWHEQSRLDRDAYVHILWENINEENWYNFNQHITDGKDYGEYDYQSIMHYSAYAFSKNHQKTIIPLQMDVEIGQRLFLSAKDIAAVNAMLFSE